MEIFSRLKYAFFLFIIVQAALTILNGFFHFRDDGFSFSKYDLFLYVFLFAISPVLMEKIKNTKK